jgi:hypothetical protein
MNIVVSEELRVAFVQEATRRNQSISELVRTAMVEYQSRSFGKYRTQSEATFRQPPPPPTKIEVERPTNDPDDDVFKF